MTALKYREKISMSTPNKYAKKSAKSATTWYWIALNGPSCAASMFPSPPPKVIPTPQMLVGFDSRAEQLAAQKRLLTVTIEEVRAYIDTLHTMAAGGQVQIIVPPNPQPPTQGQTMWLI